MDLVIDLRNGSCSAGLLTEENGKPRWIPQLLQTYIDTEETHKSVEEADLACFKKGERWIPIQRTGLPNIKKYKLPDADILLNLLTEDKDRIKKPLFHVLEAMLKEVLKERLEDLLFLVDKDGLVDFLEEFSKRKKRKLRQIIIQPSNVGEIQAYALWDTEKGFPKEGDFVQCKYSDSPKEQAFVWKDSKFKNAPVTKRDTIDVNMKPEYLEKVGVVFFERRWGQQWKEQQLKQTQYQIFEWKEKITDATDVLKRLKQIHFSQHVAGNI